MSTFEDQSYQWRETYFVLFDAARRPSLGKISGALLALNPRFQLINPQGDDEGRFESLTLHSPDDYAALDISYMEGEEVVEQAATLSEEMRLPGMDQQEKAKLAKLKSCTARFDVLHFEERVVESAEEDDEDILDPGALLIALDALVDLTKGIGIDPQAGSFL
ncbi:MAG TPA: hypothetical protein VFE24_07385 [Pirellulales bacterium]|jgi:hypothetical protein|nr:hypothetical protein [Pirellulales bacterium]